MHITSLPVDGRAPNVQKLVFTKQKNCNLQKLVAKGSSVIFEIFLKSVFPTKRGEGVLSEYELEKVWLAYQSMCIHCNARGRHESRPAHSASWRLIYGTRSELSFWKRSFYFSARKKLKGSPVVVSVATAKVEGRRRSWTGGEGCPLDPFDATDEPSGCSPSQAAIRRTIIVFNHQFGKFSHSCCVDSQTSVSDSRAKRAASEKNPCWRRSTWTRAKCGRRPLWSCCAWLSWTAFPTKKLVVDHQLRKSIAGVRGERAR